MRYLLYASHNETGIDKVMGKPDYSYWFVQKYFLSLLSVMGETEVLDTWRAAPREPHLDTEALFLFMPPHKIPVDLVNSGIPVIAWEFDTIPDEEWGGDFRNNWYNVFERAPGAITHCGFTAETVKKRMGQDYPIAVIPAPIWSEYSHLFDATKDPVAPWSMDFEGILVDSREIFSRNSDAAGPDTENPESDPTFAKRNHRLELDGVTYSFVFNPMDGRKEWMDSVTAFIEAFEDEPRATLILKVIQSDLRTGAPMVWQAISALGRFECRIVIVQAHLDGSAYDSLISRPTYVLNSSRGEGQCLPLLESMSAGVPAVAPNHTAMADYVNESNSFVVGFTTAWASWPHDPRAALRCFTFPVVWESLRDRYRESFECATDDPSRYREMADAAHATTREFCSMETTRESMREFLEQVRRRASNRG